MAKNQCSIAVYLENSHKCHAFNSIQDVVAEHKSLVLRHSSPQNHTELGSFLRPGGDA